MAEYSYAGDELDVFALARNWKAYVRSRLADWIRGDVLEVGAGIGGTTRVLCDGGVASWTALEPDARLAGRLRAAAAAEPFPVVPEIVVGTLADLPAERRFDTICYIDVVEHIDDDRGEVRRAAERLRPGGNLVVLCPAHPFLFSAFDRALGHFRRYNKPMFRAISPPGLELERLFYLDSAGMLLSLGNKLLLRSGHPTPAQIRFWDRFVIPLSRRLDRLTAWHVGKTIVGVWGHRGEPLRGGGPACGLRDGGAAARPSR